VTWVLAALAIGAAALLATMLAFSSKAQNSSPQRECRQEPRKISAQFGAHQLPNEKTWLRTRQAYEPGSGSGLGMNASAALSAKKNIAIGERRLSICHLFCRDFAGGKVI
jgi:hypothetical protein